MPEVPSPEAGSSPTRLSVVVTIVDGGEALVRSLRALSDQGDAPDLEVIVPYDATVENVSGLQSTFPEVTFVELGAISTERPVDSVAGQHELFDRRRARGLANATGHLISMIEDRGVPTPSWARSMVELHSTLPHGVIGGAISNGRDTILNWAVYFCDFGRYEPPFSPGPRAYISDVNVCYKASALAATRSLWETRFHETTIHWALQKAGQELWLSPEPVVIQHRDEVTFGGLLKERFHWGRLFAYTRVQESSVVSRCLRGIAVPVLPILLYGRLMQQRLVRRRHRSQFLRATPFVLLFLGMWSLGELVGYITGRPQ